MPSLPHSDAFVFFGATGDLAYKKIFCALEGMIGRGRLTVPIVGVAKAGWSLDQFRERAPVSLAEHGDAIAGDATSFAREGAVEAAWAVVKPVLGNVAPVYEYEPGTWGPAEADRLTADVGGLAQPEGDS